MPIKTSKNVKKKKQVILVNVSFQILQQEQSSDADENEAQSPNEQRRAVKDSIYEDAETV